MFSMRIVQLTFDRTQTTYNVGSSCVYSVPDINFQGKPLENGAAIQLAATPLLTYVVGYKGFRPDQISNPLNAELNPIRHLLALVGARHIVHISRICVKVTEIKQICYFST